MNTKKVKRLRRLMNYHPQDEQPRGYVRHQGAIELDPKSKRALYQSVKREERR